MKLHARISRIHLQVEGRRLRGGLLVTGKLDEAIGKGISDPEFHLTHLESGFHVRFSASPPGRVSMFRANARRRPVDTTPR